jgi:hypothetical protein
MIIIYLLIMEGRQIQEKDSEEEKECRVIYE